MSDRALFTLLPILGNRIPLARLGELPTPVEALPAVEAAVAARAGALFVKRDDLTSPHFGGNKVRILEVLFGEARRQGKTRVFATGAFGSNHAVATVVHAPRVGLTPGVALYPQPPSAAALENAKIIAARADRFIALPHWSSLPFGMRFTAWSERRRGHEPFVMAPGGATPQGALAYVNAALELSLQIAAGAMPKPARVVVAGGSGCTTAGLLAGFALAARLGVGFAERAGAAPVLHSVRVTPWPVTSHFRLARFAAQTSALVASLAGDRGLASGADVLGRHLYVDGRFLGRGYGYATRAGAEAIDVFRRAGGPPLETTYSAKAAAALLATLRAGDVGPIVYWATCSAVTPPGATFPPGTPASVSRWAAHAAR